MIKYEGNCIQDSKNMLILSHPYLHAPRLTVSIKAFRERSSSRIWDVCRFQRIRYVTSQTAFQPQASHPHSISLLPLLKEKPQLSKTSYNPPRLPSHIKRLLHPRSLHPQPACSRIPPSGHLPLPTVFSRSSLIAPSVHRVHILKVPRRAQHVRFSCRCFFLVQGCVLPL